MKSTFKNYIFVFLAGSLWGTIGLFVKLMSQFGSTSTYTSFIRLLFGFLLLVVFTLITSGPKGFLVSGRTLLSCLLLGVVCQGIYNICYSMSVTENGMSMASVLLYTSPVFTSITARIFFKEKLTKKKWMALILNILGCILTATGGNFSGTKIALTGILVGIGAGFTYAMSAIFGRIATDDKASPFAIAAYNFLFGSIFVGITLRPWNSLAHPLDLRILLVGILFALIPTAIGYVLYFHGLSKITQTSKVPVVCSIELVIATVIGLVIFHEAFGKMNLIGILCVLFSIAIFQD